MLPTQENYLLTTALTAADIAKTQENKTIEIRGPKKTDRGRPRRSDRLVYTEINSALTP
jgi:hypothetical protein